MHDTRRTKRRLAPTLERMDERAVPAMFTFTFANLHTPLAFNRLNFNNRFQATTTTRTTVATDREILAPLSTRLNTSRPTSSVPKRCCGLGPWSNAP